MYNQCVWWCTHSLIPAVCTSIAAVRNSNWLRNVSNIMYCWAGTYYAGCRVMHFRCLKLLSPTWRMRRWTRVCLEAAGCSRQAAGFLCMLGICWFSVRHSARQGEGWNPYQTHKSATTEGGGWRHFFSFLSFKYFVDRRWGREKWSQTVTLGYRNWTQDLMLLSSGPCSQRHCLGPMMWSDLFHDSDFLSVLPDTCISVSCKDLIRMDYIFGWIVMNYLLSSTM